jgi:hypothetical protein
MATPPYPVGGTANRNGLELHGTASPTAQPHASGDDDDRDEEIKRLMLRDRLKVQSPVFIERFARSEFISPADIEEARRVNRHVDPEKRVGRVIRYLERTEERNRDRAAGIELPDTGSVQPAEPTEATDAELTFEEKREEFRAWKASRGNVQPKGESNAQA